MSRTDDDDDQARAVLIQATPEWQPIETAPRNAKWIEAQAADGSIARIHWASNLSGEEQPAFQGWFRQSGNGFVEWEKTPVRWRPDPPVVSPTPHPAT